MCMRRSIGIKLASPALPQILYICHVCLDELQVRWHLAVHSRMHIFRGHVVHSVMPSDLSVCTQITNHLYSNYLLLDRLLSA